MLAWTIRYRSFFLHHDHSDEQLAEVVVYVLSVFHEGIWRVNAGERSHIGLLDADALLQLPEDAADEPERVELLREDFLVPEAQDNGEALLVADREILEQMGILFDGRLRDLVLEQVGDDLLADPDDVQLEIEVGRQGHENRLVLVQLFVLEGHHAQERYQTHADLLVLQAELLRDVLDRVRLACEEAEVGG